MKIELSEGSRWARGYPIVLVTGSTIVCRKQLLLGRVQARKSVQITMHGPIISYSGNLVQKRLEMVITNNTKPLPPTTSVEYCNGVAEYY